MGTRSKGICVTLSAAVTGAVLAAAVASGHPGHDVGRDWHDHGGGHGHAYGHSHGYGGPYGHGDSHPYGHGYGHHYGASGGDEGGRGYTGSSHHHGGGYYGHHGNGHAYGHHRHDGNAYSHEHTSNSDNNKSTTSSSSLTSSHHEGGQSPSRPTGPATGGGAPAAPRLPSIVSAGPPPPSLTSTRSPSRSTFSSQQIAPGSQALGTPLDPSATAVLGLTTATSTGAAGRTTSLFGVPLRAGLAAGLSPFGQPRARRGERTAGGTPNATNGGSHAAAAGGAPLPVKPTLQQPSVIQRIERVIPGFVWLTIGISLVLAAVGGAAAVWSGRRVRRQAGQFAAVSAAAMTDPLTGVLNRRGFTEAAERELARARRYERPFVLAYIDVRGLKTVNDTEGHLAGDALLKEAAQLLRTSARADDVVGRIGGDEMALLLAEQTTAGAIPVIDRINSQVAVRRAEMGLRAHWELTIGTAAYPDDGEAVNDLLGAADRRLYEQRGIAL